MHHYNNAALRALRQHIFWVHLRVIEITFILERHSSTTDVLITIGSKII